MFNRRRLLPAAAAMACLIVASGASADPVNTFTGVAAPSHVKPGVSASYTVVLANDSASPEGADRAKIGIPPGFIVGPSVQATASAAGACQPSTWVPDGELIADAKINLKQPGSSPSDELCPGAALTVVFTATAPDADGTFAWASELLRATAPFALAGAQPAVRVDGTAPQVSIGSAPPDPSNQSSPSFGFTANEAAAFECKLDDAAFASCSSPKSYTDLSDGPHTVVVKATDPAGNAGQASHAWTIDTDVPGTTITAKPVDPSNDSTPSFHFGADEGGSTFLCKLDTEAFTPCTSPKALSALADGSHTFSVKATDAAGNTGPAEAHTWIVDTSAPIAAITTKPSNPSNVSAPSLEFNAGEPSTFQCKLDGEAFAACTSPTSYGGLAEGSRTFVVKATDTVGNTGPQASYTWTIDTVAPAATITTSPADPSNDPSPSFHFGADEAGATFACKLDGGEFGACSSPKSHVGLADGSHTFRVKATDTAGNSGGEAAYTWRIDRVAPQVTISGKPANPSNTKQASFSFSANEAAALQCKLDAGAFAACTSPQLHAGLSEGSHTFSVKGTDTAGNTGTAAAFTWTVDTVAPTVDITGKPNDPSNTSFPSFTFAASESGSTFQCRLDGAAFGPCSSPKDYSNLAEVTHTFVVRATDAAGNTGPGTTHEWTIDTTPPAASITSAPTSPSNERSPTFVFAADESSSFSCKLDAGSFAPCTSPKNYGVNLTDGAHTFVVRPTDLAGNVGASVSHGWTIDTTGPIATITQRPASSTNVSAPTFAFTSVDATAFQCSLDGAAFASCTSPLSYPSLTDGEHTFGVRATDPLGNTGLATVVEWTIDTVAPAATITQKPASPSNDASPTFRFSSNETGSTFSCRLEQGGFVPCGSPKTYSGLADGGHKFTVRATDPAGNISPEVPYLWTIDTVAPTTTIGQKPNALSNVASATFGFSAEPSASFVCKLDTGAFQACASPTVYPGLADGPHTFTVKATDAADNTGAETVFSWTIDTAAPTAAIGTKPVNPTNDTTPSFTFTSESGSSVACSLDGAPFAGCTSPKTYLPLADGSHTFAARAADAAGNIGPAATYTWTIDTEAPTVQITAKPSHPSNDKAPAFSFSAGETATFACKLDAAAFATCASPKSYMNLPSGVRTFSVRPTDSAGNTGAVLTYTWTIDTTPPAASITAKPTNPSNSASPSFSFTANETGSTFQCKLDGAGFSSCGSPAAYSGLGDGPHSFAVRATDPAGNTGAETIYGWTIESRPPTAVFTSTPSGLTNSSAATFTFSADEPSSFDCSIDGRGFEPCSSPVTYHGLGDGSHGFTVRATDSVGNLSAHVAHSWNIDTTAPETTVVSAPTSGTASSATFAFSASEGGTFECRLDGAAFALCSSPKSYVGLSRATHRFEVRAIDAAGNADATPSVHAWTIQAAVVKAAKSALLTPRAGARVTRPPLLVWRRANRARYYNVQLYRGRRKVLTAWPTRTRLQLKTRWTNLGRKEQLLPGSYRWYVWPGYGAPSARRYGQMLGQSSFVVARRSGR